MTSRQASRPIEDVLREETDRLMALRGVVGTAMGLCGGKPCIKVYVEADACEAAREIPEAVGGYPVQVEETGGIRARPGDVGKEDARDAAGSLPGRRR